MIAADVRMKSDIKGSLLQQGIRILEVPASDRLQSAVSGHPDMQMVHVYENLILCHPDMPGQIVEQLRQLGFDVRIGSSRLRPDYPFDIALNVAIIGKIAFHHTKYTDEALKDLLKKCSIRMVHVNQGYTKCSILPVTSESIITADRSIAEAAKDQGFDVLFLPPQTAIRLPGLNYGFIGGTAGFIDKNIIAFTGNPEGLSDGEKVAAFLEKHGVGWISLSHGGVIDYGGLLPLIEYEMNGGI